MVSVGQQRIRYILLDWLFLFLGWLVFTGVRYLDLPLTLRDHYTFWQHLSTLPVIAGQIIIPLLMIGLYAVSGYYNNVFVKSRLDTVLNTAGVTTIGVIIIYLAVLINDNVLERATNYEMILLLWVFLAVPVSIVRYITTTMCKRRIRNGDIYFNTLVVGTGKKAQLLAKKISNTTYGSGFNVIGYVATEAGETHRPDIDLPVYLLKDITEAIAVNNVKRLLVVPHNNGMRETTQLLSSLLPLGCRVFITPDIYSLIVTRPHVRNVAGEPLIDIMASGTSHLTRNLKRISDVLISAATLVALMPFYAIIAVAIKLDSDGPVLYRQERVGYNKRPFKILKFRSMHIDAESNGPTLSALDDPRITRLGHFMRKYRIDELPQFWNVLTGDMSLVGPRPEREYYIRQIIERAPYYTLIHQVRPGITSWGMVKYGYATDVNQMIERLQYDLLYLENVSLAVDLKILFHTINTVFTGKGL